MDKEELTYWRGYAETQAEHWRKEVSKYDDDLAELEEPEHRFYVGQPVIGRQDTSTSSTVKGFYIETVEDNGEYRFKLDWGNGSMVWVKECKPDLDFKSVINWIPWNGGECPVDDLDNVAYFISNSSRMRLSDGKSISWNNPEGQHKIIRYAIIKQPEWAG